jgi:hypothetical protein
VIAVTADRWHDFGVTEHSSSSAHRRGWNVLGGGLFRDVTAERLVKALSKASALCRPGLHQTRARTSQFAAGKNTPCELVYFWKKTSRAARTASR